MTRRFSEASVRRDELGRFATADAILKAIGVDTQRDKGRVAS